MKTKLWTSVVAASGLALMACGAEQPSPSCMAGHGGWAAQYTAKPGQSLTGACAAKKGEVVGVQAYYGTGTSRLLEKLALKTATLTALEAAPNVGADDASPIISLGAFSAGRPDAEHFCSVPSFSTAEQHLPADGADPAIDISYKWSNVKLYVTATSPGQQLSGELEYTDGTCTGRYDVTAIFPAVDCGVTDDNGDYVMNGDVFAVDESLCSHGNQFGRSLQPTYPVKCDANIHLCVLDGPVPSFREAPKQ